MRRLLLSPAVLVFACAAPSLTPAQSGTSAQSGTYELGQGRLLVEERCGACHATARGNISPHGSAPAFGEIVKRYPPEELAEALAEGIHVGHVDMPAFQFTDQEVLRIVIYLKSLE